MCWAAPNTTRVPKLRFLSPSTKSTTEHFSLGLLVFLDFFAVLLLGFGVCVAGFYPLSSSFFSGGEYEPSLLTPSKFSDFTLAPLCSLSLLSLCSPLGFTGSFFHCNYPTSPEEMEQILICQNFELFELYVLQLPLLLTEFQ